MTHDPAPKQLTEPSHEERLKIERAIARDEEFRSWGVQRRADEEDRRPVVAKHLIPYRCLVERFLVPEQEFSYLKTLSDLAYQDYVEARREDRSILFEGLEA